MSRGGVRLGGAGERGAHEQALTTDQDHAIAYGDGSDHDAVDPYFSALAEAVTHGLEACGIERCRGNVMAVNGVAKDEGGMASPVRGVRRRSGDRWALASLGSPSTTAA